MSENIGERCARILRDLRRSKGFTLQEFESYTGGQIKAVVLGSYERGNRAISLDRLEQLAHYYEVPVHYFFTEKNRESNSAEGRLIFDLRRIRQVKETNSILESAKRFINSVATVRNDWNGEVISLRRSDSEILAIINQSDSETLFSELQQGGFLFASHFNGLQNP